MIKATVTVRNAASPALSALARKIADRRVPNRQLSVKLYGWVIRNINASGALQSKPWKPLAPATVKRKLAQGYSPKPLIRTGNLRQSFSGYYDNRISGVGAQASFGVDYAQVHEEGTARVPQRQMLPSDSVALNFAVEIYEKYITTSRKEVGL